MSFPLPDEIISEILSPALKISDEAFSDTLSTSPFALSPQSTSAFLLVCKAWLRVSTPLLYNVVIIRSKAQARALEMVLKTNKDLGAFIKKLRVEGGFGSMMKTILQCSPNITDLFVSLAIWSTDSVTGLCQGLPLIDPVRLIVHDSEEPGNNKQNLRLVQKLSECIQLWKKLRIVELPYSYDWSVGMGANRFSQICATIGTAPYLEEIVIPAPASVGFPDFVADIVKIPSLKMLKIKQPLFRDDHLIHIINSDPTLKELVQYSLNKSDGVAEIVPPLNPAFVPMESASSEVQDKIWSRILYFALNMDGLDEEFDSDIHIPAASEKLGLYPNTDTMLVSQQFKRLSIPYFNRHILLERPGDLARFSAGLLERPAIARHIRSMAVSNEAAQPGWHDDMASVDFDDWDDERDFAPEAEELIRPILPLLGALVSFTGGFYDIASYPPHPQISYDTLVIPWDMFQTLGTVSGASLRRLCLDIVRPDRLQSHLVFAPFMALRSLEWKCLAEFKLDAEPVWARGALANLECLSLVDCDPSFLLLLKLAELPSLRRVYFHKSLPESAEGFLERHSSKLKEIMLAADDPGTVNVLDTCPDLPLLICRNDEISSPTLLSSRALFSPSAPHLSLKKIILEALLDYNRKEEKGTREFLEALDTDMLPALREIQVYDLDWPTTEREIAKSFWVGCAESLLKKNVKMTDKDGEHWTPRLKATKR
ncbi:hypothetical protein B0H17DRAFT_1108041 [Mycena rosella]|uniref:Uncharacterized protein n=1 Tax=Mycena rosella TaxID=1033263 RepID=A0AAD7BZD0_MYCRO|nr:hypothetical protein B0H17DRAFT_1108041 [Mycena rosella]